MSGTGPYAILRMERVIDAGALAVASSHMARARPTPNADPARRALNEIIIGTNDPAADLRQRREQVDLRANSGWGVEFLLTASPEWWRTATDDQQREWRDRSIRFLEAEFGRENLAHVRWHRDETSPHVTGFLVPTKPGRRGGRQAYSAEHLLGGREKMSRLQDRYHEAVADLGLVRGVRGSTADHTSIREWYRAMSGITAAPTTQVETPPVALTNGARQRWADEQTTRINAELQDLTARARVAGIAQKDAGAARATAHREEAKALKAEARAAKAEKLSDRVRDIPLAEVLEKWGLERDPADREQWRATPDNGGAGARRITVKGTKWYDHANPKGGGGAIDLVVHLGGMTPGEAIAWLAREVGIDSTARALVADTILNAKALAETAAQGPAPELPIPADRAPVPDAWPRARRYLVEDRKLKPEIVDAEHAAGRLWADRRGSIVWPLTDEDGRRVGMEWRAARSKKSDEAAVPRGVVPGSRSAAGAYDLPASDPDNRDVLVVEGALDALAARSLGFVGRVLAVAGTDNGRGLLAALADRLRSAVRWLVGFDADAAGDRASAEVEQLLPGAVRRRPREGDWSDVWRRKQVLKPSRSPSPPPGTNPADEPDDKKKPG